MALFPNSEALKEIYGLTTTQYRAFLCLHWLLILLFSCLLLLLLVNFWQVIVKQQKYKNVTLVTFYIFSILTITLKEFTNSTFWTGNWVANSLAELQPVAKLHVGLVQCWIIFELTIHMRQAIIRDKDPMANFFWTENAIFYTKSLVLAFLCISLMSLFTYFVFRGAKGLFPFDKPDLFVEILGYLFLLLFVLMLSLNLALVYQIRVKNKMAEMADSDAFKREKCQLKLILTCFELSYGFRFIWDAYLGPYLLSNDDDYFAWFVGFDLISIFDGLSFFALIYLHQRNFRHRHVIKEPDNELESANHESFLMLQDLNESGTVENNSRQTGRINMSSDLDRLSVSISDSNCGDGHEVDKEDNFDQAFKGSVQSAAVQTSGNASSNSVLVSQNNNHLSHSAQQNVVTTTMSDYGLDSNRCTLGWAPTSQF